MIMVAYFRLLFSPSLSKEKRMPGIFICLVFVTWDTPPLYQRHLRTRKTDLRFSFCRRRNWIDNVQSIHQFITITNADNFHLIFISMCFRLYYYTHTDLFFFFFCVNFWFVFCECGFYLLLLQKCMYTLIVKKITPAHTWNNKNNDNNNNSNNNDSRNASSWMPFHFHFHFHSM